MEIILKIITNGNLSLMHCREKKTSRFLKYIYNNLETIQFDCFERSIYCLGYGRIIRSKFETRADPSFWFENHWPCISTFDSKLISHFPAIK